MESKDKKVELLRIAIKQLIEEEKAKNVKKSSSDDDDSFVPVSGDEDDADHRLLSKLLSQLDSLKDDGMSEEINIQKADCPEEVVENETAGSSSSEMGKEDIVRELKTISRQNFVTHCLLSAMIVLTVAWQLSEVSLILKVKEGLSNPLKTLGSVLIGMMKRPRLPGQEEEKQGSGKQIPLLKTSPLPGLKIPDLPHVELPVFDLVHEED